MKKRLKLRIVKLEEAIAVEQQEKYGEFSDSEHVVWENLRLFFSPDKITLVEKDGFKVQGRNFYSNEERDRYVEQFVDWITKEQFNERFCEADTGDEGLKVGEVYEFSDYGMTWDKFELIAVLPPEYPNRYIVKNGTVEGKPNWTYFKRVRQIYPKSQLTIDGEYYTWEV